MKKFNGFSFTTFLLCFLMLQACIPMRKVVYMKNNPIMDKEITTTPPVHQLARLGVGPLRQFPEEARQRVGGQLVGGRDPAALCRHDIEQSRLVSSPQLDPGTAGALLDRDAIGHATPPSTLGSRLYESRGPFAHVYCAAWNRNASTSPAWRPARAELASSAPRTSARS